MYEVLRINVDSPISEHWLNLFTKLTVTLVPVVLSAEHTNNWNARKLWSTVDGQPNFEYFLEHYGSEKVGVVVDDVCEPLECTVEDYVRGRIQNDGGRCPPYLKDWHFQTKFGTHMYNQPPLIASDWVNCEDWSSDPDNPFRGDYRFVYIGLKDTWTKFHSDVMSSHSWSANICGRKLWYFVPPGNEEIFRVNNTMIEDIRELRDKWEDADVIEFVQEPGEIVFVPSNWFHQVHNLEDAISINHNFINSSNIHLLFEFLRERQKDVEKELLDVREIFGEDDWKEQVQIVLGADARMNFPRIKQLLTLVIQDRRKKLVGVESIHDSDTLFELPYPCSCKVSVCENCLRLLYTYDLAVALKVLNDVESLGF